MKKSKILIASILLVIISFNLILSSYSYAYDKNILVVAVDDESKEQRKAKIQSDNKKIEEIKKTQKEKSKVDVENNQLYDEEDNVIPSSEQVKDVIGSGDAKTEERSKEVRTKEPGFLSKATGIILGGFLMKSSPIFAGATAILSMLYWYSPNDELDQAYMNQQEQKSDDDLNIVSKKIDEGITKLFTVDKLMFNDIKLLDVNFFRKTDINNNNQEQTESGKETSTINAFKDSVATWSGVIRLIAVAISLVLFIAATIYLIYVSVSDVSSKSLEKAKSLINNLILSIAIMFLIPVLLAATFYFSDFIIGILDNIRMALIENGTLNFEHQIYNNMFSPLDSANKYGIKYVLCVISYYWMVVVHVRFLLIYVNRFFTLAFLTVISPVISTTYAVDKISDNESDVLNKYFKEFFSLILLGIIYPAMYLAFMTLFSSVAYLEPILGLVVLTIYGRVEKTVKGVFGIRDLTTVRSSTETGVDFMTGN